MNKASNKKYLLVFGLCQTKKPLLCINRSTTFSEFKETLLKGCYHRKLFKDVSYKFDQKLYCLRGNCEFEKFKIFLWGESMSLSMTGKCANIFVHMGKQQQKKECIKQNNDHEDIEIEMENAEEDVSRKRKLNEKKESNDLHSLKKKKINKEIK
ncbi:hypothetical protein M0813_26296 [Anaeramoeba flamelloides]|uniref:Uncharacterized protein n=1 Tax=Anaeramoeba flamelloides TaxID=1746091 RepID=A0ABQ8Y0E8_9EUKA|nr:hypothetical protein M0813_26296 [Anaeramoeba flamelloides]